MNSTTAQIKQLYNVKALATAGLAPDAIPNDTFGIVDCSTGLTVTAALPTRYTIVSKVGGKVYHSVTPIETAKMFSKKSKGYVAPTAEVWTGTIECCSCIDQLIFSLNLDETSLRLMSGLSWTQKDMAVVVAPEELKCLCKCDGTHTVYDNNVMTRLLVNKIIAMNSPFYTANASISVTGITSGSTLPSTPDAGDLFIKTGTDEGLYVHDGTDWNLIGTDTGTLTDMDTFINVFETVNTDSDPDNDGPLMSINILGINQTMPIYHDIEANYIYPRGVRMHPTITSGKGCITQFTQTTSLVFEQGAGYDLRAEEYENMNYYTNLNSEVLKADGLPNYTMHYQFENLKTYNTISFEYMTDKVDKNEGDKRLFGVVLGIENGTLFNTLKTLFGV